MSLLPVITLTREHTHTIVALHYLEHMLRACNRLNEIGRVKFAGRSLVAAACNWVDSALDRSLFKPYTSLAPVCVTVCQHIAAQVVLA